MTQTGKLPDVHELASESLSFYDEQARNETAGAIARLLDLSSLLREIQAHHPRLEGTIDEFIFRSDGVWPV